MIRSCAQKTCGLLKSALSEPKFEQQIRNKFVFRRMYPPRLSKQGEPLKTLKRREGVYIVVEDTSRKPLGDMDIILMADVEGLGFAGDKITVSKRIGRNILLPAALATYVSDETLAKTEHLRMKTASLPRKSIWAQKTIRQLSHMNLPIPMNPKVEWTLNKTHVRVAFRSVGIQLTDACIVLPIEPVSVPSEITLTVIVNGTERVPVAASVYHYYSDARLAPGGILPVVPEVWKDTSVSIVDIATEYARKLGPAPPPIL